MAKWSQVKQIKDLLDAIVGWVVRCFVLGGLGQLVSRFWNDFGCLGGRKAFLEVHLECVVGRL